LKIAKSKITIAITMILAISMMTTMMALPTSYAHTPPWTRINHVWGEGSPDLIGVGQTGLFVIWCNYYMPTASGDYGDRWVYSVNIMKPDGTNETVSGIKSDPVGSAYLSYTYDQVGVYTFQVFFPETILTGYPTPGNVVPTNVNVGDIFLADISPPAIVTVQQDPIPKYEETPLPNDYWTRPIYQNNRLWYQLAGQWLGNYAMVNGSTTNINPTSQGPESAHVLWTTSYWSGGIADGTMESNAAEGYYNGQSYESFGLPSIILEGKLYIQIQTPPRIGQWVIDLYTGEKIFFQNTTGNIALSGSFDYSGSLPNGAFSLGQILYMDTPNQHGAFPYLWVTSTGTNNKWDMYDGYSNNYICSIANVSSSGTQYRDGYGGICYVNFPDLDTSTAGRSYYLQIWNTTEAIWWKPQYGTADAKTLLDGSKTEPSSTSNTYWMWRPDLNATFDGRFGFSANVSIADLYTPYTNSVVNQTFSIRRVIPDEYVIVGTTGRNDARGIVQGYLKAISLKPGTIGQALWTTTFTPPKAIDDFPNATYIGYQVQDAVELCQVVPEENMFYFRERISGNRWGYDLTTGQEVWKTAVPENGWNYYGLNEVYYDNKLIASGYSGVLIGYDAQTGDVLWNWTAPSEGLGESPYWHTTMYVGAIADGKAYCYTSEHSVNSPIRRDANIWCVDLTTGEMLWKMSAWAMGIKVADGRVVYLNSVDNQIYCHGRGPSATTVSAPQAIPALGASIMIQGTITDQSPSGRHNVAGSLDFSLKGTPAISDADQEAWMEHLYQGNTKPANAKGVEVTLEAIDPNGNLVSIGTTTSDMNGNYGFAYTPEVPGTYQIIATFAGSAAYGPSSGTTYLAVGNEAATPAPTTPATESIADLYFIPATIGIIIAIVAIGLLIIILVLRKRP
jgi:hypothetical protein